MEKVDSFALSDIRYLMKDCCIVLRTTFLWLLCNVFLSFFAAAQVQVVEEVVVDAEYIPDEKLATSEVADLLDAETISIAGDSDLGGALKRVPGLSLVGGKFIYVRGLGERYSATYFNGTPMPSPEPLQRAVPLDMFDTSITKNVLVQKTHSANFGIEFSGGLVDIRSAAVPDESFFKLKLSTAYNDISSGQRGLSSQGGSQDFLGFDDGSRALPSLIANNLGDYPNIFRQETPTADPAASFQNRARLSFTNTDFDPRKSSNPFDYGLSIGGGQRYQLTERVDVGFISIASLNNRWRNRETEETSYVPGTARNNLATLGPNIAAIRRQAIFDQAVDLASGSTVDLTALGLREIVNEERTQRTIRSNLLLSIGSVIDQQHFINLTNLIARITRDTAQRESLTQIQTEQSFERNSRLDFAENEIDFKQLSGEHILDSANIKWRYARIESFRDQLDTRDVVRVSPGFGQPFDLETLGADPTRRFSFLDDITTDAGFDIELPFARDQTIFSEFKLKIGASITEQKRQFQGLEFQYNLSNLAGNNDPVLALPIEQLIDPSRCTLGADPVLPVTVDTVCFLATNFSGNPDQFPPSGTITVTDGSASNNDDFYAGLSRLEAQYIVLDMQILDSVRFNLGIRRERTLLEVRDSAGDLFRLTPAIDPALIAQTDQLSSFSLTWDVYRNMIIRAAYSETRNRPILRELAPVRLFNPGDGRFYVGNSALRIAEIENFDLRYELYFGENDYFSVSAFKKRINNPIEVFERETTEEILAFGWENSELAINEGFETELRKYISPQFYVTANATFIDSVVTDRGANAVGLAASGVSNRPLTGVSKELYNAQLIYDNQDFQASLSYNKYSRRIDSISVSPVGNVGGVGGIFSVVVEEPFSSLDANAKFKVPLHTGKLAIGIKASNLLNQSIKRVVDNVGNLPAENYDVGQTYSLSLEWQH